MCLDSDFSTRRKVILHIFHNYNYNSCRIIALSLIILVAPSKFRQLYSVVLRLWPIYSTMPQHNETEMSNADTSSNGGSKKSSPVPAIFAKQESVYEKLDKTKFLKHYRPDDSFFQRKGTVRYAPILYNIIAHRI